MHRRRLKRVLVALAGSAVVVVLVGGSYTALVAHRASEPRTLPHPSGHFAVGRQEHTWVDAARSGRKLSVWIWYPARAGTGAPVEYMPGAWSGLHLPFPVGLGETDFEKVDDPALEDAAPAAGRYPVVVFEPGLGLSSPQYAAVAEDMASRGFVVLGVTPTGSANLTVLDGTVVHETARGNPSGFNGNHTSHDEQVAARLLPVWAADAGFAADRIADLPSRHPLAHAVDPSRVAYVGHSFGGAAALQACSADARCIAAANLDGALFGDVVHRGLAVPSLLVGHDNSCITGLCDPATEGERADVAVAREFRAASTGATKAVDLVGTGHFNFTDYAVYYLADPLRRLLGLGPADGSHALVEATDLLGTLLAGAASAG